VQKLVTVCTVGRAEVLEAIQHSSAWLFLRGSGWLVLRGFGCSGRLCRNRGWRRRRLRGKRGCSRSRLCENRLQQEEAAREPAPEQKQEPAAREPAPEQEQEQEEAAREPAPEQEQAAREPGLEKELRMLDLPARARRVHQEAEKCWNRRGETRAATSTFWNRDAMISWIPFALCDLGWPHHHQVGLRQRCVMRRDDHGEDGREQQP